MQTIPYLNKEIHYTSEGSGNCLLLIHGFCESLKIWHHFARILSVKMHVVCVDLPGHGQTDAFSDCHTMPFMAETVKAVLDHLNIRKCVVIGHSMGGYVTAAFADQYPELVKALGFFHSHVQGDTDDAKENRDKSIEAVRQDQAHYINTFIPSLFAKENIPQYETEINELIGDAMLMTPASIAAALEGMKVRENYAELLATANVPVLHVFGKEDARIPYHSAFKEACLASFSEIAVIARVGHMGFIEQRDELIHLVGSFAARQF